MLQGARAQSEDRGQMGAKRRREISGEPDPKAGDRELREAQRCIRELEIENAEFPVKMMARVLGVSRSGFYSWLANGCPEDDWAGERDAVMRVWLESDRRFGFRFVHAMLPPRFSHLTRYRVLKLMRELGIRGCTPNARKRSAIPNPNAKPRADLVRCDFTSPAPTYKLVGDIMYLRTGEGWLFLATVIDLCTRMVVGWSLSDRMTADNAVAESFFATLKNEMYYRRSFPTRDAAKHAVIEFIEVDYNRRRPHSTIGYKIPAQAMESFFERTKPESKALPMAV